jgi:hypothetical protein
MAAYRCPTLRRYRVALPAAILVVALSGCWGPSLELPKVQGIVRGPSGETLSGGMIEFVNVADPDKRATGAVDAQGGFSLTTGQANVRHSGAHPGVYEVSVYEPVSFDKRSASQHVTVPPEGLANLEVIVGDVAP